MRALLAKARFIVAYTESYERSQSHAAAIREGLTTLARRKPFNVLTPDDIERIVPVWSLIPNGKLVAELVANIVRKDNAYALKDAWFLEQLAKKSREINATRG